MLKILLPSEGTVRQPAQAYQNFTGCMHEVYSSAM